MDATMLIDKLVELRDKHGNLEVVLPQAGTDHDGNDIDWLARISCVEILRNENDPIYDESVIAIS